MVLKGRENKHGGEKSGSSEEDKDVKDWEVPDILGSLLKLGTDDDRKEPDNYL